MLLMDFFRLMGFIVVDLRPLRLVGFKLVGFRLRNICWWCWRAAGGCFGLPAVGFWLDFWWASGAAGCKLVVCFLWASGWLLMGFTVANFKLLRLVCYKQIVSRS